MEKYISKKAVISVIFICLYLVVFVTIKNQDVLSNIKNQDTILNNESNLDIYKESNDSIAFSIPVFTDNGTDFLFSANVISDNPTSLNVGLYNEKLKKFEFQEEFTDVKGNATLISNIKYEKCKNDCRRSIKIFEQNDNPHIKVNTISIIRMGRTSQVINILCYLGLSLFYTIIISMLGIFIYNYKDVIFCKKTFCFGVIVTSIVFILISYLYSNFKWDFVHVPVNFSGHDEAHFLSVAKNAMDGHSFWNMENMGAPFGAKRYDFPMLMATYYGFCRLLGLFTDNIVFVNNSYYICTFLFATLTFFLVARYLKINLIISLLGGLIYAFSQYHFCRQMVHVTASSFFVVPLVLFWCLKIALDKDFNSKLLSNKDKLKLYSGAVLSMFLVGSTDIFYAYFGLGFFSLTLLIALAKKRYIAFGRGAFIFLMLVFTLGSNLYPAILNGLINNSTRTSARSPYEAFHYGLMLVHLFMPKRVENFHIFSWVTENYFQAKFIKSEATTSYLGIFGCLGFVILLLMLLIGTTKEFFEKFERKENEGFFKILASLNIFGFLFGCVAGFGPIIALMGFTKVRTYNRISIYILLFSLLTFFYLLDFVLKKYIKSEKKINIVSLLLFFPILCTHIEETNLTQFLPIYENNKAFSARMRAYGQAIDDKYEDGAMILQLPIVPYPENKLSENLVNCTLPVLTYIFTKNLYWSYGTFAHTNELLWQKQLFVTNDVNKIVHNAINSGFNGISINMRMYPYNKNILRELKTILGEPIIVDKEDQLYFFDLTNLNSSDFVKGQEYENFITSGKFLIKGWQGIVRKNNGVSRWAIINTNKVSTNTNGESIIKFVTTNKNNFVIHFSIASYIDNNIKVFLDNHLIGDLKIKKGQNLINTNVIYNRSNNLMKTLKLVHSKSVKAQDYYKGTSNENLLTANYKEITILEKSEN